MSCPHSVASKCLICHMHTYILYVQRPAACWLRGHIVFNAKVHSTTNNCFFFVNYLLNYYFLFSVQAVGNILINLKEILIYIE